MATGSGGFRVLATRSIVPVTVGETVAARKATAAMSGGRSGCGTLGDESSTPPSSSISGVLVASGSD
ncbi:hypothetical protein E2562_006744 [Oryza meyeriana var. granulata]|uniref:Uncharacterized protein n=1 Tax=Oryza meyeriana var. granulata TaxID=110450 RepID=A0A6G1EG71_9ORYZ|nr:hypothetical protein E2562_006744 [Oryza meyeriana var. granulata]